jgi:hypothetical protein
MKQWETKKWVSYISYKILFGIVISISVSIASDSAGMRICPKVKLPIGYDIPLVP